MNQQFNTTRGRGTLPRTLGWLALPAWLLGATAGTAQLPTIKAPYLYPNTATEPTVSAGTEVRLAVGRAGAPELQWQLDSRDIPGATNSILHLKEVGPGDAGEYMVVARNEEGETVSPPLVLVLDPTFVAAPIPEARGLDGGEWVDLNQDGWLDLVGWRNSWPQSGLSVLMNARDGTLVPSWETTWTANEWPGTFYRSYADWDNDGDADLAGGQGERSWALENTGDGAFKMLPFRTLSGGTVPPDIWVDIDNNGYLDLYRTRYNVGPALHLNHGEGPPFLMVSRGLIDQDQPGWALLQIPRGYSTAWGDYDDDGRIDAFVSVPDSAWRLLHNEGEGVFVDAPGIPGGSLVSFNVEWVDYDGDADFDVVMNPFNPGTCVVLRNDGGGAFVRVPTEDLGDLGTDRTDNSCAMAWGDFDNDGDLDVYRTSTHWETAETQPENGRLYVNQGAGRFQRIQAGSPTSGLGSEWNWYLASWGDYDNDGFLDLIGSKQGDTGTLAYRNNLPATGNANHWLKVRCIGRVSNRDAVGAKVRVKAALGGQSRWQLRQVIHPGGGGPLITHFGLADAPKVEVLRIEWPSGAVQEFRDVTVNQSLVIQEPPKLTPVGSTSFAVACWKGMAFDVEASVDLRHWTPVGTVLNADGTPPVFTDTVPAHGTCRFYRVTEK